MFFVRFLQAQLMQRRPNYDRGSAISEEPQERQIGLSEEQLQTITQEYHGWRMTRHNKADPSIAEKRLETFLHFLSIGGYYKQVSFPHGLAPCRASGIILTFKTWGLFS